MLWIKSLCAMAVVCFLLGTCLPDAQADYPVVNINTADEEALMSLPRIGPAVAKRIIEYREENKGFERIEELMNVRGIGQKTFDRLKERITVGEAKGTEAGPGAPPVASQ